MNKATISFKIDTKAMLKAVKRDFIEAQRKGERQSIASFIESWDRMGEFTVCSKSK